MLHLTFENPALPKRDAGPFEALEVTAQALWAMPEHIQLATHENSMWVSPDRNYYTSVAIHTPCVLRFKHDDQECSTSRNGEAEAKLADGAIYHGGKLVARLDESQNAWQIYEDRKSCAAAEILPAARLN
jgi:hypothetical protein